MMLSVVFAQESLQRLLHLAHGAVGIGAPQRTDGSFTGSLLEKIVNGSDKGERNNWLTSITGSLFNTGMNTKQILILLHVVNQNFVNPPLPNREVETVFKSILRKESAKLE